MKYVSLIFLFFTAANPLRGAESCEAGAGGSSLPAAYSRYTTPEQKERYAQECAAAESLAAVGALYLPNIPGVTSRSTEAKCHVQRNYYDWMHFFPEAESFLLFYASDDGCRARGSCPLMVESCKNSAWGDLLYAEVLFRWSDQQEPPSARAAEILRSVAADEKRYFAGLESRTGLPRARLIRWLVSIYLLRKTPFSPRYLTHFFPEITQEIEFCPYLVKDRGAHGGMILLLDETKKLLDSRSAAFGGMCLIDSMDHERLSNRVFRSPAEEEAAAGRGAAEEDEEDPFTARRAPPGAW